MRSLHIEELAEVKRTQGLKLTSLRWLKWLTIVLAITFLICVQGIAMGLVMPSLGKVYGHALSIAGFSAGVIIFTFILIFLFGESAHYWGVVRYLEVLLKLDPDRPATTIQSQPGPYVGPFHWRDRRLRQLEVKRLQTFPDDYVVVARGRRSWQHQLGNAVPPMLAEIVAKPLADAIAGRRERSAA